MPSDFQRTQELEENQTRPRPRGACHLARLGVHPIQIAIEGGSETGRAGATGRIAIGVTIRIAVAGRCERSEKLFAHHPIPLVAALPRFSTVSVKESEEQRAPWLSTKAFMPTDSSAPHSRSSE